MNTTSESYVGQPTSHHRPYYVWDYNISTVQFRQLLDGTLTLGRLNRDWAALRLIEYAFYEDMIRLLGYRTLAENWLRWRPRVRVKEIREGLDFVVSWVTQYHPELLEEPPASTSQEVSDE